MFIPEGIRPGFTTCNEGSVLDASHWTLGHHRFVRHLDINRSNC